MPAVHDSRLRAKICFEESGEANNNNKKCIVKTRLPLQQKKRENGEGRTRACVRGAAHYEGENNTHTSTHAFLYTAAASAENLPTPKKVRNGCGFESMLGGSHVCSALYRWGGDMTSCGSLSRANAGVDVCASHKCRMSPPDDQKT